MGADLGCLSNDEDPEEEDMKNRSNLTDYSTENVELHTKLDEAEQRARELEEQMIEMQKQLDLQRRVAGKRGKELEETMAVYRSQMEKQQQDVRIELEWIRYHDQNLDKFYFYHAKSGDCRWDLPAGEQAFCPETQDYIHGTGSLAAQMQGTASAAPDSKEEEGDDLDRDFAELMLRREDARGDAAQKRRTHNSMLPLGVAQAKRSPFDSGGSLGDGQNRSTVFGDLVPPNGSGSGSGSGFGSTDGPTNGSSSFDDVSTDSFEDEVGLHARKP